MGKSTGTLVGFTSDEVVLLNEQGFRLHFPLWNFTVRKATEGGRFLSQLAMRVTADQPGDLGVEPFFSPARAGAF